MKQQLTKYESEFQLLELFDSDYIVVSDPTVVRWLYYDTVILQVIKNTEYYLVTKHNIKSHTQEYYVCSTYGETLNVLTDIVIAIHFDYEVTGAGIESKIETLSQDLKLINNKFLIIN